MQVAVFLSSRKLPNRYYKDLTRSVGRSLVREGHRVIYGGGFSGMMGVLAKSCLNQDKEGVFGVTTEFLIKTEAQNYDPSITEVVTTMGERKETILSVVKAVVVLPGGLGTLDELFEALTLNQLGLINCPIFVLDSGLENILKKLFRVLVRRGAVRKEELDMLTFVNNTRQLTKELAKLERRIQNEL